MAATFDTATKAQLTILHSEKVVGGKTPAGAPYAAPEGYQWARKEITMEFYRIGQGLTKFSWDAGVEYDGTSMAFWGGGAHLVGRDDGLIWVCLAHDLVQEERGTDIWRESVMFRCETLWTLDPAATEPAGDGYVEPEAE